jgi:glycosyltransferase involved in cell wall biosynthesis
MPVNRKYLDLNFLYVSSHHKHKNLVRLIKAFINACQIKNISLSLNLTIEDQHYHELKKYIPDDSLFNLINHGYVSKEVLSKLYSENTYFIYPSLKESFGIPLLEAESYGARLLCADLPYVHEIVSPSGLFNPLSVESIVNCLIDAIDGKVTKASQKKINNKIDNFTNYIMKDV